MLRRFWNWLLTKLGIHLGIGVGKMPRVPSGGGGGLSLGALVLTRTSPANTNPPTWDWNPSTSNPEDGDTVELYYTTDGSTPVANGSPQGSITFDARTETINWGTAWPTAFADGVTVKWGERFGRLFGGAMVWAPISNILSDVMPVSSTPDFVQSANQPASDTTSSTSHTFTGIDFVAGYGVVYTAPANPAVNSVTVAGTACTKVHTNPDTFTSIWVTNTPIAATASASVVVTYAGSTGCAIMCGTLKNITSITPVSTADGAAWGSQPSPVTTTSALTIGTNQVGIGFGVLIGSTASPTSNSGTFLCNGMLNYGTTGETSGIMSKSLTPGSFTPSFSHGTNWATVMGAVWG